MAQTYTLDEAAQKLGIPVEEFKRKLKGDWKALKSFRDGPTLRFRSADIDELARSLGQASDPGLQPGDAEPIGDSSDEIGLDLSPPPSKPKRIVEKPLSLDDSDEDILALPLGGDSGVTKKKPKVTGDSDVRLDMTPSKADSVKEPTEEISLDLSGPRSGILKSPSSAKSKGSKLKAPESGKISGPKGQAASEDSSSEFELSLDSDSDSFELQLNTDSSEEVDLGAPPPSSSRTGQSGINLRKPADSGVSLEQTPDSDSDIDFELSLDAPGAASGRLGVPLSGGKKSGGKKPQDSDSEFELSLDDNSGITDGIAGDLNADESKGDIFETDFELPVVSDEESGSEVVAIDSSDTDLENSDFDIAISDDDVPLEDESASQVMLVDDEPELLGEETTPRMKKKRPLLGEDDVMLDDVETESGGSASSAMRRAQRDEDDVPVRTVLAKPASWGPLPAVVLLPCLLVVVIGGLMSFEVLRGMWGYQQPSKTSDALVRGVAGTLGMKASE